MPTYNLFPTTESGNGFGFTWISGQENLEVENDSVAVFQISTEAEGSADCSLRFEGWPDVIPEEEIIVSIAVQIRRSSTKFRDEPVSGDALVWLYDDSPFTIFYSFTPDPSTLWGGSLITYEYGPVSIPNDETNQTKARNALANKFELSLDVNAIGSPIQGSVAWVKIIVDTFSPEFWSEFVLSRED